MAKIPLKPDSPAATDSTPKTYGVVVHYGSDGIDVAGLIIDSYKRDAKFAKMDEITGKNGLVEGVRMSDYRVDVSVSGRLVETGGGSYTSGFTLKVGDVLTIDGEPSVITSISESISSSGFTTIDLSATSYEAIGEISPK